MDYTQINYRLRSIKEEIYKLNNMNISNISEKIELLKTINLLLREQNQLLNVRQALLANHKNLVSAA